jgi:hypothetical protein
VADFRNGALDVGSRFRYAIEDGGGGEGQKVAACKIICKNEREFVVRLC